MRAPHRGRHSLEMAFISLVGAAVFVGFMAYHWNDVPASAAAAKTPPADAPMPALTVPAPSMYEFVDRDFHCHYFGSSAGGMTPRLKGVNAEGVGMPWCDR